FQAEDGIRGRNVTGVQTCALPIYRQRAARYGLNVADIQDVIETAVGGKIATEMWEGEKRFGVVVRLRENERRDIAAIKNILVDRSEERRVGKECRRRRVVDQ